MHPAGDGKNAPTVVNPFREPQRYGGQLLQQPPYRSDFDSTQAKTGTYPANPVLLPKYNQDQEDPRMKAGMSRTPSPTPSVAPEAGHARLAESFRGQLMSRGAV